MPTRTLPSAFAGLDAPPEWPPTPGRPRPEALALPVGSLPGVGPGLAKKLAKLGLETVGDLALHAPRDYQRPPAARPIRELAGENEAAISGVVVALSSRRVRNRLSIQKAQIRDGSGTITAVWFNQDWLRERLPPGTRVRLRGVLKGGEFAVRSYDAGDDDATADFAPVYPGTEDLN